jgi:hypothetical protein
MQHLRVLVWMCGMCFGQLVWALKGVESTCAQLELVQVPQVLVQLTWRVLSELTTVEGMRVGHLATQSVFPIR